MLREVKIEKQKKIKIHTYIPLTSLIKLNIKNLNVKSPYI